MPEQIAPDLFGAYDPEKQERQALDDFGNQLVKEYGQENKFQTK